MLGRLIFFPASSHPHAPLLHRRGKIAGEKFGSNAYHIIVLRSLFRIHADSENLSDLIIRLGGNRAGAGRFSGSLRLSSIVRS
jgi:hypothetical protein